MVDGLATALIAVSLVLALWAGVCAALESLTAVARAGADVIVTYFALDAASWLSER